MTNHSPNTEQRERAEFEAWSEGHAPGHSRAINENGNYEDYATECAWAGWHARATQAAPASPEPIMWVESEPSARLLDLREVIDGMCHTVMYHSKEPHTDNPVWPLYDRAPASPNTAHSQRVMAETADTISEVEAGLSELDKQFQFRSSPNTGAVLVPRADLEAIDRAMQHIGDQINEMDGVEDGDLAIVSPGFEALARLLATPSPSKGGEADSAAEDTARIDWLEAHCTGASDSERYLPFRVYWGSKGATQGLRVQIDKARAESARIKGDK